MSLNSLNSLNSLYKTLREAHLTFHISVFSFQFSLYFLGEEVRLGLDKEIAPDGTYLAYFPFGAMIERSRKTPYHKKLQ